MMDMTVRAATPADVGAIVAMIEKRIRWMDQNGIRQWNLNGYLEAYPAAYYAECAEAGQLYVAEKNKKVVGAMVLLDHDESWEDGLPAVYIHNLVSDGDEKGAGRSLIQAAEAIARQKGVPALRLDCQADNPGLNAYYESLGFRFAGTCTDGPYYTGNRREKTL